jgi:murein tripeptide amidase MpaA
LAASTLCASDRVFSYRFTNVGERVRFAVTIPYLQRDLDAFLDQTGANPYLTTSVLTNSLHGRPVALLQIGAPGPGVKAVLMTARHHACETMASLVLEGFLRAAMSGTPAAVAFRQQYVLYCVPFVDKDGVEEGDQGKGRLPHDHNRDYGQTNLYPEIRAMQELGAAKNIQFLVDFHCPTLRGVDHQGFYLDGPKSIPANNYTNALELARTFIAALPPKAPGGPAVWLSESQPVGACSGYFAARPGAILSIALEVPFAPPNAIMDPATVRNYGEALLNAWMQTTFLP